MYKKKKKIDKLWFCFLLILPYLACGLIGFEHFQQQCILRHEVLFIAICWLVFYMALGCCEC